MVESIGVYEALKKLFVTDKDGHITIDNASVAVTADWPATFPDTATEPRNVKEWGGTALTGRDITADIAPCTAIGTIADVTAAAAATQLTANSTACRSVVVRSLGANTGSIRVGDSNVGASRGEELSPGDAVVLAVNNVNLVYVRGNGTDKVSVTYVN
jgi:hypothetical protein